MLSAYARRIATLSHPSISDRHLPSPSSNTTYLPWNIHHHNIPHTTTIDFLLISSQGIPQFFIGGRRGFPS